MCYQIKEKDLETSITDFQKKNENMGKDSKNALARWKKKLYNFFIKAYECGCNNAYMIFIKMLTEPSKSWEWKVYEKRNEKAGMHGEGKMKVMLMVSTKKCNLTY